MNINKFCAPQMYSTEICFNLQTTVIINQFSLEVVHTDGSLSMLVTHKVPNSKLSPPPISGVSNLLPCQSL
jgi:hypothetical protein